MEFLAKIFFGNTVEKWLIATLLAIAVFVAMRILKSVFHRKILELSEKTATRLDDLIAVLIKKTTVFFLLIISIYFGSMALALPHQISKILGKLVVIALLVQGAILGWEIFSYWLNRQKEQKFKDTTSTATFAAMGFIFRIVLWATVVLLILDNLGVKITTLVAGLGVGGIAVALAVQNILGDLFASLSILLDKPFVIGDFIIVDDFLGSIEYIGLKTTRIRSLSGEQVIFANSDLLKSRIRNYNRMFERRVLFSIGLVYQTPYEKLAAIPQILKEIISAQESTRFERAHFKEYGDFSLNFEIVYWVKSPDYNFYMNVNQAIHIEIFRRFGQEGIEFAYPTQTLFLSKETSG